MAENTVLVLLGHPDSKNSFNGAIARTATAALEDQGYSPVFRDLYAEGFDPILTLIEATGPVEKAPPEMLAEIEQLKACYGMVFVHPNWWGSPPAMLRGWVDRVLRNRVAYGYTEEGPWQGLNDKVVQVFSTSNTPRDYELEVYGDPLERHWKNIVFGVCGSKSFERRNFQQIILSDEATRKAWLAEVDEIIRRRFVKV